MKRTIVAVAAAMALSASAAPAMDHGAMNMDHGSGMMAHGTVIHEEVVDNIKATFSVTDIKESMQGMEMPKGMKETHHLMAAFTEVKTGKVLAKGEVKAKVQAPDKSEQVKDLMGMEGHFGADFDLSKKGNYGIMAKFKVGDQKVRTLKFWYAVK
jgi:hypothetical protein